MKVGIVLPVYNQKPQYIYECIKAIEAQTYRNFRLIIVLDGPNQETVQAIYAASQQLTIPYQILHIPENKGFSYALNEGFARLDDCPFFTWVSSDDRPLPHFLDRLVSVMRTAPRNVVIAYSLYLHIDKNGGAINRSPQYLDLMRKFMSRNREHIMQVNFIGVSHLFRREAFLRAGGYNPDYGFVADYEFWMRLLKTGDILLVNEYLFEYRLNSEYSNTNTAGSEQLYIQSMLASANLRKMYGDIPKVTVLLRIHNQEKYISQALESVLNQTLSNFHIVIIDDGSSDHSFVPIHWLTDARAMPIKLEATRGKADAMNLGLNYVLGEYILELNGKDWIDPQTLAIMVNEMDQLPPSAAFMYADRKIWYHEGDLVTEGPVINERKMQTKYDALSKLNMLYPRLYRTSALRAIGGWPAAEYNETETAADFKMMLLLAENFSVHHVAVPLYHQRVYTGGSPDLAETAFIKSHCTHIAAAALNRWNSLYIPEVVVQNGQVSHINLL